ncbi:hypothetical protein E4U09_004192 [Claviceps aff. purpurea]|uniref:Uncharacterized protein n=1 Tax=Claviceps aff. purpurea TaxID=1967640 RepID=A0A9P7QG36_9HYPO|nr:hypothetical protein E4U09_004192 [Claviceps aff. purpurea]
MVFVLGIYLSLWALAAYAKNPLVINLDYLLDPLPPGCDCNGTDFDSSLTEEYLCGDRRLGPMNFTYTVDDDHPLSYPPTGGYLEPPGRAVPRGVLGEVDKRIRVVYRSSRRWFPLSSLTVKIILLRRLLFCVPTS